MAEQEQVGKCRSGKVFCRRYDSTEDSCHYSDDVKGQTLSLAEFPNCPWVGKQLLLTRQATEEEVATPTDSLAVKAHCKVHGDDCVAFVISKEGSGIKLGPFCCQCLDGVLSGLIPKCSLRPAATPPNGRDE
jgi:hypothetical protein